MSKHNASNASTLRDYPQKVVHSITFVHVVVIPLQSLPSATAFFGRLSLTLTVKKSCVVCVPCLAVVTLN